MCYCFAICSFVYKISRVFCCFIQDLLVTRVRYMGADVRTDISEVSYVIAIDVSSSRYEVYDVQQTESTDD